MSLLRHIATAVEPGPDPVAVAQGLTVRRVGWGHYVYSGLPAHVRGRQRHRYDPNDPLDRLWYRPAATTPQPDGLAVAYR